MVKKILIAGNKGQVGSELTHLLTNAGFQVFGYDYPELDIVNRDIVQDITGKVKPDILVNCAAYTAVDMAETDAAVAMAVNADGPANLALTTAQYGIPLIHISTDYVFDGTKKSPYLESDTKNPLGVYGKTKSRGEDLVLQNNPNSLILRTSWVFSKHGHNFVKTIVRLSEEREELKIVADQTGCPTSAREIARAIKAIIEQGISPEKIAVKPGIYNFCQPQPATWYDFAFEIVTIAKSLGFQVKCRDIHRIKTSEYPTPAARPENSVLNTDKISQIYNLKIPEWKDSLIEVLMEWKSGK